MATYDIVIVAPIYGGDFNTVLGRRHLYHVRGAKARYKIYHENSSMFKFVCRAL